MFRQTLAQIKTISKLNKIPKKHRHNMSPDTLYV